MGMSFAPFSICYSAVAALGALQVPRQPFMPRNYMCYVFFYYCHFLVPLSARLFWVLEGW